MNTAKLDARVTSTHHGGVAWLRLHRYEVIIAVLWLAAVVAIQRAFALRADIQHVALNNTIVQGEIAGVCPFNICPTSGSAGQAAGPVLAGIPRIESTSGLQAQMHAWIVLAVFFAVAAFTFMVVRYRARQQAGAR